MSRCFEVLCLLAAAGLLVACGWRLCTTLTLDWWVPCLLLAGGVAADFVSGLVHWAADTWGRESMAVVGPRFLKPFRVHHVNPDDLLRRSFVDCNGDVAMLILPVLVAAVGIPLDTAWGPATAVFLTAFAVWALPTNQVHQWAHMPAPPRLVQQLQRARVILDPDAHRRHHASPHVSDYCITTGWCNRWLTRVGFFPRLERAITRMTGCAPREDERAWAGRS